MNITVILDAGHGGIIDGVYQTPGKRSPIWENGSQYFEGVGNRQIVSKLTAKLKDKKINVFNANDSEMDMKLSERVSLINKEIKNNPDTEFIGISVHSNAFTSPMANGWEVFTANQCSVDSLVLSSLSSEKFDAEFPNILNRGVKKSDFYILKNTICPFILTENLFHTNKKECKEILMTKKGQDKIVNYHLEFICKFIGIE
tara:strand:+ start:740 stop:1342 length:603 start_codon:yes stop_codon:yes gene_type:complete